VEHVVFFPAPDGTPAFRRVAGLEEAVRFVEQLRNVENVSGASVHSLTEIPLTFKAWYRVELPGEVAEPVEAAEPGSATGIVVPDQPLVAVDQFDQLDQLTAPFVPTVASPAETDAETAATAETAAATATNQYLASPQVDGEPDQAQLLEPVFGGRRERGLGFFAR
jgi:hypothetical protein